MICASFSPGGVFFCVGSADHNVRVYQMNCPDGPQRILEEEVHEDRVDSIQWCNSPDQLRFLSGSKDGTARIWTFKSKKWHIITLNMKTGDNQDCSSTHRKNNSHTSATSSSRGGGRNQTSSGATGNGQSLNSQQGSNDSFRVTMVSWTMDDTTAITAVSNNTLKLWDTYTGKLKSTLHGHEDEIFVLEPHPIAYNLLLSSAHDGQIIVWDLETSAALFKYKNMVEDQNGHAAVYDSKWSPNGLTVAASDSHGHLLFLGHGSTEKYDALPVELFFHTDYRPLLRDSYHNVVDEQTQVPPHLLPPPFLVDSEGSPYPGYIQMFVPGREKMSEREALLPGEAQPQDQQQDDADEGSRPGPSSINNTNDDHNGGGEEEVIAHAQDENSAPSEESVRTVTVTPNTTRRILSERDCLGPDTKQHVAFKKTCSAIEVANFNDENSRTLPDHDYARPGTVIKEKKAKPKSSGGGSRRRQQQQQEDDDDEEEEEREDPANEEDDSSDCSLDESDLSPIESTTEEETTDHSYWGSDGGGNDTEDKSSPEKKKAAQQQRRAAAAKKKRSAAQKCRDALRLHPSDITEEYSPSAWLSQSIPKKAPYFPQVGDVLMYFKQGHEKYIELVKTRKVYTINMKEQEWMRKKINDPCLVKIVNMRFEIKPPRLCVLKLAILNQTTKKQTGESFTIKYHDMNDVVDFLVLYEIYKSSEGKNWKSGDRIRCQIDDCWWKGTVMKVQHHDANKRSPFLSLYCHWDNGEKENLSPWDLEALDGDTAEIPDGTQATPDQLKSTYQPTEEEWNCMGLETESRRISEALEAIMSLAIAEPFNYPVDLTLYPEYMLDVEYPVDLNLVKARIDSHFYRRIDAVVYDVKQIAANAASFNRPKSDIVRNAKIITELTKEIVQDSSKTKDEVSAIYHRLVENFEWSEKSGEEDEDSDEDSEVETGRASSLRSTKSSTTSPPNLNPKKWKHDCNELLNDMAAHPLSVPFREPVSQIEFPDYHRYITTPMDISTVRESLLIGDYSSPLDFQKDVLLIFKNSREYNTDKKAKIWSMTNRLEEWFEDRLHAVVREWRKTKRKLGLAKTKKSKNQESRKKKKKPPPFKGKGKGKGKGQSNQIRKSKPQRHESEADDDEEEEQEAEDDDAIEEESEHYTSEDESSSKKPKPKPSRSARARNKVDQDSEEDDDTDEDFSPKPSTSRAKSRTTKTAARTVRLIEPSLESERSPPQNPLPGPSRISNPGERMMASLAAASASSLPRRFSSRVPKPPVRYRDNLDMDTNDDEVIPNSGTRRSSQRSSRSIANMREDSASEEDVSLGRRRRRQTSSAIRSPTLSNRPKRKVKLLRRENYAYFDNDGEEEEEEQQQPRRRAVARADSRNEVATSPKKISTGRARAVSTTTDDDDVPLARKLSAKTKIAQTNKSAAVSDERPRRNAAAKRRRYDDEQNESVDEEEDAESEEYSPVRKNAVKKARAVNGRQSGRRSSGSDKKKRKKSDESESEFEVSEDTEEEEEEEEEESEGESASEDDVSEDDVPIAKSLRKSSNARGRLKQHQPKLNSSKRAAQAIDSESERVSARKPTRLSTRNVKDEEAARSQPSNSSRGSSRRAASKRSYYEGNEEEDGEEEFDENDSARENRRPRRAAAAKRSRLLGAESSEEDDRPGRKRTPNSRII